MELDNFHCHLLLSLGKWSHINVINYSIFDGLAFLDKFKGVGRNFLALQISNILCQLAPVKIRGLEIVEEAELAEGIVGDLEVQQDAGGK